MLFLDVLPRFIILYIFVELMSYAFTRDSTQREALATHFFFFFFLSKLAKLLRNYSHAFFCVYLGEILQTKLVWGLLGDFGGTLGDYVGLCGTVGGL